MRRISGRWGKSGTVATLFAGVRFSFGVGGNMRRRGKLIEAGAIVGLATDYNPGTSPTVKHADDIVAGLFAIAG